MTVSPKFFKIGDFATVGSGTTPARAKATRYFSSSGHEWVKTGDLTNSVIRFTDEKITPVAVAETNCRLYPSGTVLVAMYGGFRQIGRTGLLERPAAVNQAISAIQVDPSKADPEYLMHYLNHAVDEWKKYAASSRKDPNITRQDVESFPVPLPSLSDQRKIAQILRTWDDALERTHALITRLQGGHRRLLQGLVARHAAGSHVPLGELVEPVKVKNTVGETNVLTSSARDGLVSQNDYFKKSVAGKNLSGYYLLHRGDFAYNRSSSAGHPFGAIRRLHRYDRGVISTLYLCFRLRNDSPMTGTFLQNIFNSGVLDRQLSPICHEGARSHGLLNIARADFFELVVPLPSRDAQTIANKAIAASSRELELVQREAELLRTQKRGLMQKLLTGRLHINVAAEIDPGGPYDN